MSSWYTRAELAHCIAWYYSGSSLANAFGGLVGAGVLGNLHNAHGISGWRWLFIIEGKYSTSHLHRIRNEGADLIPIRRYHRRRGPPRHIHLAQLSRDDKMAYTRAAVVRTMASYKRCRRGGSSRCIFNPRRSEIGLPRPEAVPLRSLPARLDPQPGLPILLPHHREDSWIRQHRNAPDHRAGMDRYFSRLAGRDVHVRSLQRPKLPYRRLDAGLLRRERHSDGHLEPPVALLRHVPHAHGRRRGLPDHPRMGGQLFPPTARQALRVHQFLQLDGQLRKRLRAVHVQCEDGTEIHTGGKCDGGSRVARGVSGLGD